MPAEKEVEVIIAKDIARSEQYAENIINTVGEPLLVLDQDLRVVSASRFFYIFFEANKEDTIGQRIYDLGNRQWNIPRLRKLLETILPENSPFENYEVKHDVATIGNVPCCSMPDKSNGG